MNAGSQGRDLKWYESLLLIQLFVNHLQVL
jgi:hypothetical protein